MFRVLTTMTLWFISIVQVLEKEDRNKLDLEQVGLIIER